jgi:hypothetical protein
MMTSQMPSLIFIVQLARGCSYLLLPLTRWLRVRVVSCESIQAKASLAAGRRTLVDLGDFEPYVYPRMVRYDPQHISRLL